MSHQFDFSEYTNFMEQLPIWWDLDATKDNAIADPSLLRHAQNGVLTAEYVDRSPRGWLLPDEMLDLVLSPGYHVVPCEHCGRTFSPLLALHVRGGSDDLILRGPLRPCSWCRREQILAERKDSL